MSYKTDFIEFMVRSGVLRFGDFTTKSGRKSPYFVNTGNYRTGAQMSKLGKYYAECLRCNSCNRRTCCVHMKSCHKYYISDHIYNTCNKYK